MTSRKQRKYCEVCDYHRVVSCGEKQECLNYYTNTIAIRPNTFYPTTYTTRLIKYLNSIAGVQCQDEIFKENKKGKVKMKSLIRWTLICIIQFSLAHGGIKIDQWEWWAVTIGYCVYAAVCHADF